MTAKEAREKVLWNELPLIAQESITWAVNHNQLTCDFSLNQYPDDVQKLVYNNLNRLGYTVVVEGYHITVYWTK